jgi:YHS domain-containing protein
VHRRSFCTLAFGACGSVILAQPALARSVGYYARNGVALGGVDPVAYLRQGEMRKGQAAWQIDWRGVTWVFSSAENLAVFESDPHCYVPQFGGHCAFGMSEAMLIAPDPRAFVVHDERLYLMASTDYRDLWLADPADRIMRGRANWAILTSNG